MSLRLRSFCSVRSSASVASSFSFCPVATSDGPLAVFVGAAPTKTAKGPSLVATGQKLKLEATEADDLTLQKLRNRKDIRELNLSYTTVTDAGLANLQSIPTLRVLRLAGTQIDGSGLAGL